ncbi:hypothetical protein PtA15_5A816 [Puccinia triticina]|uniref:Prolyl 4-hydroxylase alpha subunit domain-containing protein n=1 Tax=Puccinia triticina TaxID=208348 RepID=A0ABY7CR86_9BASI|nr:uncharacterized protein PtA15_5A816 [Puccinia triticina]WAQ85242.1 hypothetical protein PtA15_5A816 [Puccinia triticina]
MAQPKTAKKNKAGQQPASSGLSTGSHGVEPAGWPSLKTKPKLKVDTIIRSQIMTVNDLLTEDECGRVIRALDHLRTADGHALQFETTSRVPKRGEAFRFNDRISFHDPVFAHTLWSKTGLKTSCESWLREQGNHHTQQSTRCWGLNPNLRFYRYRVGHKFEKHFDESVQISKSDLPIPSESESEMPETLWTEYTLLIYLTGTKETSHQRTRKEGGGDDRPGSSKVRTEADSEPLQGGETVFYNTPIRSQKRLAQDHSSVAASVTPVAGLALIHRHGSECLLHEARQVTAGAKYVLRSDLVFG